MDLVKSNVNEQCLACLGRLGRTKFDLFTSVDLFKKYMACTSIIIKESDGFPSYLCKSCLNKLELLYEFREMCIFSIDKLRRIVTNKPSVEEKDPLEHLFPQKENVKIKIEDDISNNLEMDNLDPETDGSEVDSLCRSYVVSNEENQTENKSKKPKPAHTCTTCNKIFYKIHRFQAHLREHQGLKPFVCQICDREYSKSSGLFTHTRRAHKRNANTNSYICTFENCDKVYKTKDALRNHCKKFHMPNYEENKSIFICELCGKIFSTNAALKRHGFSHSGELPFKCDQCSKRYVSRHKLKEHYLRHKGIKNFVCPHCGLRKTTKHELNVHINYHTKEKVRTCELCSASFSNIGNLNRHINVVHKGIKAFPCKYCDQSFGKAETLKHHEMIHTGEKPHECVKCGRRFIQLVALRMHLKRHTKKDARSNKE